MSMEFPSMRPDWDSYFMHIAISVSARGECLRSKVGAVIVKDRRIVSTGYNGAPAGMESCLDGVCPRAASNVEPGSSYDSGAGTCIALHAEQNAVLWASREDREGSTLYVTRKPCEGCWRTLQGSGIKRVVWARAMEPHDWWPRTSEALTSQVYPAY